MPEKSFTDRMKEKLAAKAPAKKAPAAKAPAKKAPKRRRSSVQAPDVKEVTRAQALRGHCDDLPSAAGKKIKVG